MRIRFLIDIDWENVSYSRGQSIEVSDGLGEAFILRGVAQHVANNGRNLPLGECSFGGMNIDGSIKVGDVVEFVDVDGTCKYLKVTRADIGMVYGNVMQERPDSGDVLFGGDQSPPIPVETIDFRKRKIHIRRS